MIAGCGLKRWPRSCSMITVPRPLQGPHSRGCIRSQSHSPRHSSGLAPNSAASARFVRELAVTGVTFFARQALGEGIEVRSFAPYCGVEEDPVCGSGNGSVAVYRLLRRQITDPLSSPALTQGQCVGRSGEVFVSTVAGQICVGGQAVTTVDGKLSLG